MSDPTTFQFDLPDVGRPADVVLPEFWYPGVRDYWGRCTNGRLGDPIFGIRTVVIHATAGASSAGAVSVMREGRASFHWLLPAESEPQHGNIIWACAPEARAAWHVRNVAKHPDVDGGRNKLNHRSLGIELVNTQVNDPFSDWKIRITAQIVRYCWAKYPNLTHVVSHAKLAPGRRSDPGRDFPWDIFRELVLGSGVDALPAIASAVSAMPGVDARLEEACCVG